MIPSRKVIQYLHWLSAFRYFLFLFWNPNKEDTNCKQLNFLSEQLKCSAFLLNHQKEWKGLYQNLLQHRRFSLTPLILKYSVLIMEWYHHSERVAARQEYYLLTPHDFEFTFDGVGDGCGAAVKESGLVFINIS